MKQFKKIYKLLITMLVLTTAISATAFAEDTLDSAQNKAFLSALYEQTEPAKNDNPNLYASINVTDYAVMRSDSDPEAREIAKLPSGYNVTVIGAEYGWVQISNDDNKKGYVKGDYLDFHIGTKPKNTKPTTEKALAIVNYAKQFIGTPYVWGGTNLNSGVDCSGLVYSVYKAYGIQLNRSSKAMFTQGTPVSKDKLQTGDLIFFNTSGAGVSHVGMYVGNNNYIEAANSGVKLTSLSSAYATRTYIGAKRILL